jgi:hypothetical protein
LGRGLVQISAGTKALLISYRSSLILPDKYWDKHILRMPSSGMLRRAALVRTDVSEEHRASIIRATKIGELGTLVYQPTQATKKYKVTKATR